MRTILISAAAALMLASPASSAVNSDDICSLFAKIARSTMEARQNNAAMSDMMTLANDTFGKEPDILKVVRTLIRDAYKEPRYSTDDSRTTAVDDFVNATTSTCYTGLEG